MKYILPKLIPAILIIVGVFLIFSLVNIDRDPALTQRLPGTDGTPQILPSSQQSIKITGKLASFDGVVSDLTGSWPEFRGPNRDAISPENFSPLLEWPEAGPRQIWQIDVGEGYAGAVVFKGRVYIVDYDRQNQSDLIRCLSLDDGKDIWNYSYPVKVKRNHGMSRTVPVVTDDYLIAIGPKCHVTCLDSDTGEYKWMIDLESEYGTKVPPWYAGQCPLIDNGRLILAPGGENLMIALDPLTGNEIWKSENPNNWAMTHSSITPVEFASKRMYVYCGSGGVAGISADDGKILWETNEWKIRIATVPTPIVVGEGLIFFSGGYNAGSVMLKLTEKDGQITPDVLFRLDAKIFGSPQQTPIFYQGHIYGVRPDGQLVCLDLQGNILWSSSAAHKFGLGPYVIANGLIYVMNDDGLLSLAKAQSSGFELLTQGQVLGGHDAWGPMAIASGRLILRDLTKMVCLDISKPEN